MKTKTKLKAGGNGKGTKKASATLPLNQQIPLL